MPINTKKPGVNPPSRRGRPKGARDPLHEARRRDMLERMRARLSEPDAMHASYRELAEAAGASLSTVQHYFGKRTDIVAAVLADARHRAAPFLAQLRAPASDFAASVEAALAFTRLGFQEFGLSRLFAMGLAEGLGHSELGPLFVADVLELSIAALAERLAAHQRRGQMRPGADARHAAIALLSPLVLSFLHQNELGGHTAWPLDLDRFLREHAEAFARAYGTDGFSTAERRPASV